MTYGHAPIDFFVPLHALYLPTKFRLPTPNFFPRRPFCSGHFGYGRNEKMGLGVSPCRTCVPNFVQIRARLDTETLSRRSHAVFKMADFLFDIWSRSKRLFCASSCPLSAYQVSVAYAKLFSSAAILQRPFWLRPKRKNGLGVSPCRTCVPIFVQIR